MRRFETTLILDPDLPEDGRAPVLERIGQIISQQGGLLVEEDHWGARRLAYPIKKKPRGYYVRFDYCGLGPLVDELERFGRIDDRVMKYMTLKLTDAADVEQIQAEMAARAEAAAAAEAAETAAQDGADSEAAADSAPAEPAAAPAADGQTPTDANADKE